MRLDPMHIQQQINNLLLTYPELAEDDVLRVDMIEGETDAFEYLSHIVRNIGETKALASGISDWKKTLDERLTRFERREEAFRSLAFKIMQAADIKKAELPEATLSIRNGTPKVVITDETALPGACLKTTVTPDKTAIKEMITNGVSVPGALMSNGEPSLSIRVK